MKRVLSLFSPPKKLELSPAAKRPRASLADVYAHLDSIERIQSRLLVIDKDCAREQLAVQRSFDAKKYSILEQRKEEISKIPLFWVTAIGNHPFTDTEAFVKDREILAYLESIDLEDNLDDNGSYFLRFKFDSDSNPFFSNAELVRRVTILDDQTETVTATPILWAPKKQPTHPRSFFAWFSSSGGSSLEDDFGEVLRRDLWQNPYPYYLNLAPREPSSPSPE